MKSDGDTQCLNDLVGDGDDGAEAIDKFKCRGSYTLDLPNNPTGCLPNCPSSAYKIKNIVGLVLFTNNILSYTLYLYYNL